VTEEFLAELKKRLKNILKIPMVPEQIFLTIKITNGRGFDFEIQCRRGFKFWASFKAGTRKNRS